MGREEHGPLVDVAAVERVGDAPADGAHEAAVGVPALEQRDVAAAATGGAASAAASCARYLPLVRREANGLSGRATTSGASSAATQSTTPGSV